MAEFKTPKTLKLKSFLQDRTAIQIPESPLMTKIGYGTGVSVYKLNRSPKVGKYQSPWAIKKLLRTSQTGEINLKSYADRLKEEAGILQKLNHPNIVGFRAFVKTDDGRDCLAMEECDTSVGDMIEERCDQELGPFPAKIILKVALAMAKALDYLHTECHLLHGDIKSFNILVKGDFDKIKLCDFGVSVPLKDDDTVEDYVGTSCWIPPEALCDGNVAITSKADIYSFGLVLWEMTTLQVPNFASGEDEMENDESHLSNISNTSEYGSSDDSYTEVATGEENYRKRPSLPAGLNLGQEYKPVIELYNLCTEDEINKRPSARKIVEWVESL